jgi:Carboxypeptidase regulatory-like domain
MKGFQLRLLSLVLLLSACAYAVEVTARIKGTVTDPTGAVLPNITITATNQDTGVATTTTTLANGDYIFQKLPIGTYSVSTTASGFSRFTATGIVLNIDQEYVLPIKLTVGSSADLVEVKANGVQVNSTDMQLSNVVDSHQITELPLIGRAFTNLELILPGVQASSDRFTTAFSVNGSQTQQSAYVINGADTNDLPLNTISFQPNIDALQEFNLLTGPLNAEYDRNSGAIISTSIKTGTNHFHGDVFEFYRDTFLNTRNFFQKNPITLATPTFHQNIFGGTIGGPILKDKLFIFFGYQGTRQAVPQAGGNVRVFSPAQLAGNYSGTTFTSNVIPATISIPGCTSGVTTFKTCFASGQVPVSAFNPVAANLVKTYVPASNSGTNTYTFNPIATTPTDQYLGRIDFSPGQKNQIYFVGLHQKSGTVETLPFTGATIPGFGDYSSTSIYQFSTGWVRQINSTAVNDLEVHYTRFNFDTVEPQHVVQPSSLGFSITPQISKAASVPTIAITGANTSQPLFTLGFSTNGPQPRIDQVYQANDSFTKTLGHHNLKFGYDWRKYLVFNPFGARNSGSFSFTTASNNFTTGDAGLDFLLGMPATYAQGSGAYINAYAFLNYMYAQDTWKATQSLTLSYGLGWQIDTPLHNLQFGGIGVTCFIPGQQSKIFGTAPKNLSYPGDPGCNNASGATIKYTGFGPRFGFAWAPDLGVISGGNERKFSVRGGYGIYYNRTEEESSLQNLSDPPFGLNSSGAVDNGGVTNPGFANPFQNLNVAGPAGIYPNKFPFVAPVAGSSPNFAPLTPFGLSQYNPAFRSPYSENVQLTLEREFPGRAVARVSYVGTFGRHNQAVIEGNPETQAGHDACLADPKCSGTTTTTGLRNQQSRNYPTHTLYGYANANGLNDFTSMGFISSVSTSNYNSLQLSVDKSITHGLQFQASYTLAHALDDASSFEGSGFGGTNGRGYNQFSPRLNYGNSTFDYRNRFVIAPIYVVPFKKTGSTFSPMNLLLSGWQISGIATFATGSPFDVYSSATSNSLWCSSSSTFYACPDIPNQTAPLVKGNLHQMNLTSAGAPNNTVTFFQTSSFAAETIGSFGNISRNRYHGPGINNTNFIIGKNFALSSDGVRMIQIRMESDNVFNHTQFLNPTANFTSGNFGLVTSAAAARQTQLAAKIYF